MIEYFKLLSIGISAGIVFGFIVFIIGVGTAGLIHLIKK